MLSEAKHLNHNLSKDTFVVYVYIRTVCILDEFGCTYFTKIMNNNYVFE